MKQAAVSRSASCRPLIDEREYGATMSLPIKDFRGQNATVSMMELRSKPGEVFDLVANGLCVRVEKNGKHVGTIVPPDWESESTTIESNGKIHGRIPLTYRRKL